MKHKILFEFICLLVQAATAYGQHGQLIPSNVPSRSKCQPYGSSCPTGWYHYSPTNRCFKFMEPERFINNFTLYENLCKSVRASQIKITSLELHNLISQRLPGRWWYIGLVLEGGAYRWRDGSGQQSSKWSYGCPRPGSPYGPCVVVSPYSNAWMDVHCQDRQAAYICEKAPETCQPIPPLQPSGTDASHCPAGWYYFQGTDGCYLPQNKAPWAQAEQSCVNLGGHISSVHSEPEHEFIMNLVKQIFDPQMCFTSSGVWMGSIITDQLNGWTLNWTDCSKADYRKLYCTDHCGLAVYGPNGYPPPGPYCIHLFSPYTCHDYVSAMDIWWKDEPCTNSLYSVCKLSKSNCGAATTVMNGVVTTSMASTIPTTSMVSTTTTPQPTSSSTTTISTTTRTTSCKV